jgi:ATP-binding cassette subfamily C protein
MIRRVARSLHELVALARWKVAWAIALMVALSLTEGIGIALLLPTLEAAGMDLSGQGAAGRYAALVSRSLQAVGLAPDLLALLVLFVVVLSARSILGRATSLAMYRVKREVEHKLRTRLYHSISRADWLLVCRLRASELAHALTAEIGRIGSAVLFALQLAADLILTALYVCLALALSFAMTVLVIASGAVLTFFLRGRTRMLHAAGEEISTSSARLYSAAIEHVESLKAARAYGAEPANEALFTSLSGDFARASLQSAREHASATAWFEIGSVAIMALVLVVALRLLAVPPAVILILLAMFTRVMPRFMSGHQLYRSLVGALPAFDQVRALQQRCDQAAEVADGPAAEPPALQRELRLDRVTFAYAPDSPPVVRNLSLAIPAGRVTALVGASGSGKSTIADLAMALLWPSSGSVSVDGVALRRADARAWRQRVGYVAPETFLFHDTIRNNLRWARADASDDDLWRALETAAAAEFVRALPARLDSVVGDRGVLFSHGERQRLALARALVRRPCFLVLDEATNNLDAANEAKILDAIAELPGGATVLLIAHRLAAVRRAHVIYVIDGGECVESGAWDDLAARPHGRFRALCDAHQLVA